MHILPAKPQPATGTAVLLFTHPPALPYRVDARPTTCGARITYASPNYSVARVDLEAAVAAVSHEDAPVGSHGHASRRVEAAIRLAVRAKLLEKGAALAQNLHSVIVPLRNQNAAT